MYARITELRPKFLGNAVQENQEGARGGEAPSPAAWLYVEGRVFHHIRARRWRAAIPAFSTFLEADTMESLEDALRRDLREKFPCRVDFRYEPGGRVLLSSPDAEAWGKAFLALLGPNTELILRNKGKGRG